MLVVLLGLAVSLLGIALVTVASMRAHKPIPLRVRVQDRRRIVRRD